MSFSFYADRGRIDLLAWHPLTRSLLIVELKTEISDLQETLGTMDMKRRRAREIAGQRGWDPKTIGVWLVVADTTAPSGPFSALTFWSYVSRTGMSPGIGPIRRVRRPRRRIQA